MVYKANYRSTLRWKSGSVFAIIESVGMFPVWYEGQADEVNPFACFNNNQTIEFEHLHIHHWKELVDILEKI